MISMRSLVITISTSTRERGPVGDLYRIDCRGFMIFFGIIGVVGVGVVVGTSYY